MYKFRVILFDAVCSPFYAEFHPAVPSVSVQIEYSTRHAYQPICGQHSDWV